MSVSPGQSVKAEIVNNAFMSRLSNTSTLGQVDLEKPTGSGAQVTDVQQVVNNFITVTGMVDQNNTSLTYSGTYVTNGSSLKAGVQALDTQLLATQTQVTTNSARLSTIESAASSFGGDKTFTNDVIVAGNLTVQGALTSLTTTNTEIKDQNITLNKGGNDASSAGAGFTVERVTENAAMLFDNTLTSKFKIGLVSALYEILVSGIAQVVTGIKDFVSGIKTDTIAESTANAGVTIDGLLIKDGGVAGYDSHIADATIHFTEASIDHSNILNIGTNSHANIDLHIASTSNPHATTKAQVGLGNVTDDAQLKRAAADFDTFTEKVIPVNDDIVLIEDSENLFVKKKVKLANMLGGGGGGASVLMTWSSPETIGAVQVEENGLKVYEFESNLTTTGRITTILEVPSSYTVGSQPTMTMSGYAAVTGRFAMRAIVRLIRPGLQSISSTTYTQNFTSDDFIQGVGDALVKATVTLTSLTGEVNAQPVAPGDYLYIELTRVAPTISPTSSTVKLVSGSIGVTFV